MHASTRELLQLFVDKVDEMLTEEFRSYVKDNPKPSFKFRSSEGIVSRIAPSTTLIKSFATSYRLFVSGENISIRGLSKVTQDPEVSTEWKEKYTQARDELNKYLRDETNLHIGEGGKPVTPFDISDIFLNGWIFHVKDAAKTEMYRKWASHPLTFHAAEQEFILTMLEVSRAVEYIANACRKELSKPEDTNAKR